MKVYYIQETELFCDFENHFPSNNQQTRKTLPFVVQKEYFTIIATKLQMYYVGKVYVNGGIFFR